jgi:hypothetical protein
LQSNEEWIGLERASSEAKVPATTIRGWYRSGAIQSTTSADGQRLILLSEVLGQATGAGPGRVRAPEAGPVMTPERIRAETEAIATRSRFVNELQDIARARLEKD